MTVQRAFKLKFNVDPPSILKWHRNFIERGCICDQRNRHSGQPSVSEQVVDCIRESFLRSSRKSMCRASRKLKVPQSTVNKILYKCLWLHPYRLQLVQKLHLGDKETRHAFCGNLQALMINDDDLLAKLICSDEETFHLSGKVNRYIVRIRESENPHATLEVERDSPKLKVFCAVSKQTVYGPFIFEGQTITGRQNLGMLTNWLIPQLAAERHDCLFQQRWGAAAPASRSPHVSQRALAKQMDWPHWTK